MSISSNLKSTIRNSKDSNNSDDDLTLPSIANHKKINAKWYDSDEDEDVPSCITHAKADVSIGRPNIQPIPQHKSFHKTAAVTKPVRPHHRQSERIISSSQVPTQPFVSSATTSQDLAKMKEMLTQTVFDMMKLSTEIERMSKLNEQSTQHVTQPRANINSDYSIKSRKIQKKPRNHHASEVSNSLSSSSLGFFVRTVENNSDQVISYIQEFGEINSIDKSPRNANVYFIRMVSFDTAKISIDEFLIDANAKYASEVDGVAFKIDLIRNNRHKEHSSKEPREPRERKQHSSSHKSSFKTATRSSPSPTPQDEDDDMI
ncbi:Hypothetical protein MVR_LOCUS161 [uncultured virus]|nr:Hypothetical protein MVR_LOCUS161 [uncultured virus]